MMSTYLVEVAFIFFLYPIVIKIILFQVTWYRNELPVLEGDRFRFVHEGNFYCVDVAPVTLQDAGRWTCTSENQNGRASSSSHLNVLG